MSVAVLDFQNLSRDTGDAWLGQGIAGELTSRLGQVGRLTVASRSAVQRLRDPAAMRLTDVGRSLNAAWLVNGTVQRSGPRLRVTAELVRVTTGAQVWSEQFDRTETDLLAIQEAVARAVATAVTGRLLPGERAVLTAQPTQSSDAYAAYLRGRALYQGAVTRSDERAALAAFERAVGLDSSFGEAWAALSQASAGLYWEYADRSAARLERARVAADRARVIAPDAASTHLALGFYYYWGQRDYERAMGEFAAVLIREPNNAAVHAALANVARRQGDFARSAASRTRAIELDPENVANVRERALTWTWLRRFDLAERDLTQSVAMDPRQIGDLYGMQAYLMRDGSVLRVPERAAAIAASVPTLTARALEDPEVVFPLVRLADNVQSAIVLMTPPEEPQARAGFFVTVGVAHAARHQNHDAALAYDSARVIIGRLLVERPDDDRFHAVLGLAYAGLSDCGHALAEARRGTELLPMSTDAMTGAVNESLRAQVEVQCGLTDEALARLELLLSRPSPLTAALLRGDPAWAPLRGNPRFERLIAGN